MYSDKDTNLLIILKYIVQLVGQFTFIEWVVGSIPTVTKK